MKIVGLNLSTTRNGEKLDDGGCCLVENGKITVAIAEERVSRKKHDGGFSNVLKYCLDYRNLKLKDVDLFVISSCCEEQLPNGVDIGLDVDKEKIITVSHHLSHAYSAFMVSPFKKAIIMVLDNEGNIIGDRIDKKYWKNSLERSSYYIGKGNEIKLLERDMDEKDVISFGEAYRIFSHFLGWPSFHDAGKVMALAAYGRYEPYEKVEVFRVDNRKICCNLKNHTWELDPCHEIKRFGDENSVDFGHPREPQKEITQRDKDVAFLIQDRLEKALLDKVNCLYKKTGIENLCIGGGVGLNCVVNVKILEDTPIKNIFVQPAANDQGQCIGNALYGYNYVYKRPRKFVMKNAYLGKQYSEREILGVLNKFKNYVNWKEMNNTELSKQIASLLSQGEIIALFVRRSEFGPRALGHRSIIADPRNPEIKERIDKQIKFRESFRPYAPAVLQEYCKDYFEFSGNSPFMTLAVKVRKGKQKLIPAVIHVNNRARIQTVTKKENGVFYNIINEFRKITGIPMLLNTSFNKSGEPIVESPEEAMADFLTTRIDYLVMNRFLIRKNEYGLYNF